MIRFRQKGDFKNLTSFLEKANKDIGQLVDLDKYGKEGVAALASATPSDSGRLASSWYYKIERKKGSVSITFCNSDIENGIPIAILLYYGHATRSGGWVEGRDYISPVIQPIFDKIAVEAWKEVTKL